MAESKVGRYQVKSEIGVGGMATVFLAYDPNFKRDVAIKILPAQFLDNPILRARFEREAQTIAALEHPAIVPVYDFGEQNDQLYLVMRYMSGGTLSDRLKMGAIPLNHTIQIISRLAPALDEAHKRGIIHRDLKPGNILFDQYDNAFISDFGIARLTEATTVLTGEAIIGTPAYMSPEQARGEEDLDGRSDIYSLGTILFEMLSGSQPYRATTPIAVAMKHITEPVPSILKFKPDLPAEVETVISTAMAKERDRRYARATQLSDTLQGLADRPATQSGARPAEASTLMEDSTAVTTTPPEIQALRQVSVTHPPTPQPSQPITPPSSPGMSKVGSSSPAIKVQTSQPITPPSSPGMSKASPSSPGLSPARQPAQSNRRNLLIVGGIAILLILCVLGVSLMGGTLMFSSIFPRGTASATSVGSAPQPTSTASTQDLAAIPVAVDLFQDDFSDPTSGWPSGGDNKGQYGYVTGSYRIFDNEINYVQWVTPNKLFADVSIQVDATKVSGADDNYFGIMCRYQDDQNYYYFLVSSNGYYVIGKYKNGQYNALIKDGWLYSDYIHQGETTNRLRADCIGNTLALYINDSRLSEVDDSDFGPGDIGLTAASLNTAGTEILFDNFVARKP